MHRHRSRIAVFVVLGLVSALATPLLFAQVIPIGRVYLPLIVQQPTPPPAPVELLQNGSFEQGPVAWTEYSRKGYPIIVDDPEVPAHSGVWKAWLGGDDDELSAIIQPVTLPDQPMILRYWHLIASNDLACSPDADIGGVLLDFGPDSEPAVLDAYPLCVYVSVGTYVPRFIDVTPYRGRSAELVVLASTDSAMASHLLVDDLSLEAQPVTSMAQHAPDPRHRQALLERWRRLQTQPSTAAPAKDRVAPTVR